MRFCVGVDFFFFFNSVGPESSLVAQWVKDLVLSLLCLELILGPGTSA